MVFSTGLYKETRDESRTNRKRFHMHGLYNNTIAVNAIFLRLSNQFPMFTTTRSKVVKEQDLQD
jgi:hypothetical protein